MQVKIHPSSTGTIIAVADTELIGKTLKDKQHQITVSASFYQGEEKTEAEVIHLLEHADNVNLIGKQAIPAGLKAKIIVKENISLIQGIPHAQACSC